MCLLDSNQTHMYKENDYDVLYVYSTTHIENYDCQVELYKQFHAVDYLIEYMKLRLQYNAKPSKLSSANVHNRSKCKESH